MPALRSAIALITLLKNLKMTSLTKVLFSLLPYQKVTLLVPLTTEEVSQILMGVSATHLEVEAQSFWGTRISYRYQVYIKDQFVRVSGPFGNRISPLVTKGNIQLDPSHGKALLQLIIRPNSIWIIQVVIPLCLYFGVAIFGFGTNGVLPSSILPLIFQFLFIYSVLLYNFRYSVGLILQMLKQTLKL